MNLKRKTAVPAIAFIVLLSAGLAGCGDAVKKEAADKKIIAVTYSIMGSLVKELAGDRFRVVTLIPNGFDPHEWEPSARDMEELMHADLIVENGLGLEAGLEKALARAREAGIKRFIITDHVTIRKITNAGEGPDPAHGAGDPHIWTDPLIVEQALTSLTAYIKEIFGVDLSNGMASLSARLKDLDRSIKAETEMLDASKRTLITGHESLGYFALRYGFTIVGAVVPGLTSQAEVSAADMAALKKKIKTYRVKAVFTEFGTPPKAAEALARETGARAVPLAGHVLPDDLSYFTMMRNLTRTIVEHLK